MRIIHSKTCPVQLLNHVMSLWILMPVNQQAQYMRDFASPTWVGINIDIRIFTQPINQLGTSCSSYCADAASRSKPSATWALEEQVMAYVAFSLKHFTDELTWQRIGVHASQPHPAASSLITIDGE